MANEFRGLDSHSAEYFGDSRDHWWNEDFLRFLAGRWEKERLRVVLDVGCGVGHWGRLIGRILGDVASVTGIDREQLWVEKARERVLAAGLGDRFRYELGAAEKLAFEDGKFDLVTCQTVLIHVANPRVVIGEMVRVTRPGGLVLVAEPTNLVTAVLLNAIALDASPEAAASLLRFQLTCQKGKAALGEGDELVGESLPSLLAAAGLLQIELRQNDRIDPVVAPYSSPAERACVEEMLDLATRDMWIWNRSITRRYFLAGGGHDHAFEPQWTAAIKQGRRAAEAVSTGKYSSAGGTLFYIGWGRKPQT